MYTISVILNASALCVQAFKDVISTCALCTNIWGHLYLCHICTISSIFVNLRLSRHATAVLHQYDDKNARPPRTSHGIGLNIYWCFCVTRSESPTEMLLRVTLGCCFLYFFLYTLKTVVIIHNTSPRGAYNEHTLYSENHALIINGRLHLPMICYRGTRIVYDTWVPLLCWCSMLRNHRKKFTGVYHYYILLINNNLLN